MVTLPIFPIRAVVGELNGKLFVGSYRSCLDNIDGITVKGKFAVVVVGEEVSPEASINLCLEITTKRLSSREER